VLLAEVEIEVVGKLEPARCRGVPHAATAAAECVEHDDGGEIRQRIRLVVLLRQLQPNFVEGCLAK